MEEDDSQMTEIAEILVTGDMFSQPKMANYPLRYFTKSLPRIVSMLSNT